MSATPFATKEQMNAYWRALTGAEGTRADLLLDMASNRLRLMAEDLNINLDVKAASSVAYASTLQWVVLEAVKRALQTPTDVPPVDNYSQTAGPYSENYKFTNPSGDLWFKKSELAALSLYGRQSLNSISTTTTDIYGS